jgi:hypothetical protein
MRAATDHSEVPGAERSEDVRGENLWEDEWAARHNHEIWLSPASGMYHDGAPPPQAEAERLKQQK